jgi:hypothetical protein
MVRRLRRCEKIKTAHAKSQSRQETQSGSPFFPLRALRETGLCVHELIHRFSRRYIQLNRYRSAWKAAQPER